MSYDKTSFIKELSEAKQKPTISFKGEELEYGSISLISRLEDDDKFDEKSNKIPKMLPRNKNRIFVEFDDGSWCTKIIFEKGFDRDELMNTIEQTIRVHDDLELEIYSIEKRGQINGVHEGWEIF